MSDLKALNKTLQMLLDYSVLGKKSPVFISGTDTVTIKDGFCIHFKSDTVINTIVYDAHSSSDSMNGEAYLGGDKLFIKGITSIKLDSGEVHVYEAK